MTGRPASDATAQGSGLRLLVMLAALAALYTVPILRVLNPITALDIW